MAFFGPRLDRPSAVGTEGRPRATSLTIASVVAIGLFVLAGWAVGSPRAVLSVGTMVGFTVAGAALQTRHRLAERFVGHLAFLPFATLLVARLVQVGTRPRGLMLAGFIVAMVALGLTWANVGDRDGLGEAAAGAGLTYASLYAWIVAGAIVGVAYTAVVSLVTGPLIARAPAMAFVAFAGTISATAFALRMALGSLPILQLTPRTDRDRVRDRLARYQRGTTLLGVASGIVAMVSILVFGFAGGLTRTWGVLGPMFGVLGSPLVLGPVVVVGTVAVLAAVVAAGLRVLTTHVDASTGRLIAAIAAAGLFFALFLLVALLLPGILSVVVLSLALLIPIGLLVVLVVVIGAVEFGVIPDRAGGPAIAAAGLVAAAIGAGMAGIQPPIVFAIVAGALVVWDVSTYGLGITAELGHLPETRRLELFHGVLAVGVGAVAVLGLWGIVVGRRTLRYVGGGPVAAAVLVVGVLLLAAVLRG